MGIKLTHQEFERKGKETHNGIYSYKNFVYDGLFKASWITCPIHGDFLQTPASHIHKKSRCSICFPLTITNEIIDQRIKDLNLFDIIERYEDIKGSSTPILWKCKVGDCNNIWLSSPGKITAKEIKDRRGCPKCNRRMRMTNESIDERLQKMGKGIKRKNDVVRALDNMEWECDVCKHVWITSANSILNFKTIGSGCPKCANYLSYTNEEIDELVIKNNSKLKRIEDTINNKTKIKWQCETCNYIWEATPYAIVNRKGTCQKCRIPKGETRVEKFLKEFNLKYDPKIGYITFEDLRNPLTGHKLRFDFLVYDDQYKILCIIEFDGPDHYPPIDNKQYKNSSRFNQKTYEYNKFKDIIKNRYCDSKNIKLIRIFYQDIEKIEDILKEKLNLGERL